VSVRTVTEPTLRALLAQLTSRGRDRREVVAIAAEPRWNGDELLTTDAGPARIVPCVSPLAVRSALVDHREHDGELLVLLTDLDDATLGEEVLGRVWDGRVHHPTSWLALQQLAKVDRLDPQLAGERWLVELLVSVAPTRGYPPPTGGMLTIETAWRYAYRYALQLPVEQPRLLDLLSWAQTDTAQRAVRSLSEEDRARVAEQLARTVSPAATHLLAMVAAGKGADAVPTGLLVDVLWRDESDHRLAYGRGQLISGLGAGHLDGGAARAWGAAAVEVVAATARSEDAALASSWRAQADTQLAALDAADAAAGSRVLPSGFTQRLEQAGHQLQALVAAPDRALLEPVERSLAAVAEHLDAGEGSGRARVHGLEAAVRLARWLVLDPATSGEGLAAQTRDYRLDGAWVDAARDAVQGETVAALADALAQLFAQVDARRHDRDRRFAAALASWSALPQSGDDQLLPIEHVLERLVAPLAQQQPVLVLVVDGLSHAACGPLLRDLGRRGWQRTAPSTGALPAVLSVLPSVTTVSRTSLLCGELQQGDQATERDGFASHSALRAAGKGTAPQLFHRADLGDVEGHVAPKVQQALLDTSQRVVGIVVNGADDHLAKGSQLRLAEGLSAIRPLAPIEQAASEAGRAIVLVSDHGHVLDHGTRYVHTAEPGGERWRATSGASADADDEVVVTGPRVLLGGGEGIVAAATERIRYVKGDKRGYHGGATPAEVLCALEVLTPAGVTLEGFEPAAPAAPLWWRPLADEVDLDAVASTLDAVAAQQVERAPAHDAKGRPVLFGDPGELDAPASSGGTSATGGWIGALLASPLLAQQRAMGGRASLDDTELASLVGLLVGAGGTLPTGALASHLDISPVRLRGKLDALRRLLNLDGYEVVELRGDGTVALNIELLSQQFGVSPS